MDGRAGGFKEIKKNQKTRHLPTAGAKTWRGFVAVGIGASYQGLPAQADVCWKCFICG